MNAASVAARPSSGATQARAGRWRERRYATQSGTRKIVGVRMSTATASRIPATASGRAARVVTSSATLATIAAVVNVSARMCCSSAIV